MDATTWIGLTLHAVHLLRGAGAEALLLDGRTLAHCFAGCSVEAIVSTVGLELSDLFPPRPIEHAKGERRPFPAADVLQAVAGEALLIAVTSANQRRGVPLSHDDHERVMLAAERLQSAARLADG